MERKIGRPFGLDSRIHTSVGIERRDESLYYFLREKEGKVDVMKIENESLRAEKEEMYARNERSKSKIKAYQDVIKEKEKEIGDLKEKITENDNSAMEIRRLKDDLKQHKAQIQELQKRLVTKEKEISQLQKELRNLENHVSSKNANEIALDKSNQTGTEKNCEERSNVKEHGRKIEEELRTQVTKKEEQINMLKFELQELEKQNDKGWKMRQKQHEKELILKEEEIKLIKFEFEQAEKNKLKPDEKLETVEMQCNSDKKDELIKDVLVREEKFKCDLENAKSEIVLLRSELKAKVICVEEKRKHEIELEKQILYKNEKIDLHNKELAEKNQHYNLINDKCKDLRSKLESCKENCKVMQEQLQVERDEHKKEVSNAVNELEERCRTLQMELENEKRQRLNESQQPNERSKALYEIQLWEEKCNNVSREQKRETAKSAREGRCKDSKQKLHDGKITLAELNTLKEKYTKLQQQPEREIKTKESLTSSDIDALEKQIAFLESNLKQNTVTIKEKDKAIESSKNELQLLKEELANREKSMEMNDVKMKQQCDKLKEIEEKYNSTTDKIKDLEDLLEKERDEHKLQGLEQKIFDLEKEIEKLKQENVRSRLEVSDLKLSNSRVLASKKELEKRERISDKQVWNLQEKVCDYESIINNNNVILEEQKQINQKQKEQLEFLQRKEREHNEELQKYKSNTKNDERVNELLSLLDEEKKKVKENEERCRILEEDKQMIIKVVELKDEEIKSLSSKLKESQQSVKEYKKLESEKAIENEKVLSNQQEQKELTNLQHEKEMLKNEYDNKLYNNKIKMENLEDDKDMLKRKLQKLQDESKNNETEVSVFAKKIEHLTKKLSELETSYLDEKGKVMQSNKVTIELNTKIDQLIADKEILQELLDNEKNAKATKGDMDENFKELENEIEEKDIQIGELQLELVAQDQTIDDLTRMNRELQFLLEEHNRKGEKQQLHMSPNNSHISDEESYGIPLAGQFVAHPKDCGNDTDDYYDNSESFDQHDFHPNKSSQEDFAAGQHRDDSDGYGPFVPTLGMLHDLMSQQLRQDESEYIDNNHVTPQKIKVATIPPITKTLPPVGKLAPLATPAFPTPAGKLVPLAPINSHTTPSLAPIKKTVPLGGKLSRLERAKKLPPIKLGKKH
ncbi:golgin subfamily A member 6-like protein 25 [Hydractinia symbiolongicarpus]|uniref:golgin subfamily A member 6-like protein 25 n=1 Tax=Hydractinia symbiolongicarpus TaxID=13093 RepID=UPI00254DC8E2|nr:golgin subfamily A member 6-like protein 25 [Hydractinia symbiolongicarpus]